MATNTPNTPAPAQPESAGLKRQNALHVGARKKPLVLPVLDLVDPADPACSCVSDPLVHHGRHFSRTLHAMSNVHVLITNGILCMGELVDQPDETFTAELVTSSEPSVDR
jgi:hypothetical protein